jgi:hypothetical protein
MSIYTQQLVKRLAVLIHASLGSINIDEHVILQLTLSCPQDLVRVSLHMSTQERHVQCSDYIHLPHTNVPSGSPGSRLTRRCSQSSRSFAWSLYACVSYHDQNGHTEFLAHHVHAHNSRCTHVIFILHIHLPSFLPQPHRFLLCNLLVLPIVPLVSQCRRRSEHERACDNSGHEW